MDVATIVGLLAALASMISFSPQAWKIIKSGNTEGLSAATYSITVAAFALWIAYGVMLGQWPLIVSNGICLFLSGFILVMTLLPPREAQDVAAKLDPVQAIRPNREGAARLREKQRGNMTTRTQFFPIASSLMVFVAAGCGDTAQLAENRTTGAKPELPPPTEMLLPTVKIAPAVGWPKGAMPTAAAGLRANPFARDLDHPRWLYVLPNGDVLVAETNAPERPEEGTGVKGFVMGLVMQRAGAAVPSANRITLLRDVNGDGVAELRTVFLEGLNSPFGMALVGDDFFVANTDAILRFAYSAGQTKINGPGTKLAGLPGGPLNHHWTKGLIASGDRTKLYASVGSNSNAGENGIDKEADRAQILEIEIATGKTRSFATGLRNPVGMALEPQSGALWTVVNERDELGSDLVPDYLTSVRDGAFYGWPYSYFGRHVDTRVTPPRPDLVKLAVTPDYALGNHVAPLGLAFATSGRLSAQFANGAFVGEHGSWNRNPLSGYKVVFVPFADGRPTGPPVDVLTGFVDANEDARGRPVGVALDREGSLLVADDVGNVVWRVSGTGPREVSAYR